MDIEIPSIMHEIRDKIKKIRSQGQLTIGDWIVVVGWRKMARVGHRNASLPELRLSVVVYLQAGLAG